MRTDCTICLRWLVGGVLMLAMVAGAAARPTDFVLRVLDDDGEPVEGAQVVRTFFLERVRRSRHAIPQPGSTDRDGSVRIVGPEDTDLDVVVTRDGYYESRRTVLLNHVEHEFTMLLRERRDPIAMAVRNVKLIGKLRSGARLGYDLLAGDFTIPDGGGTQADLTLAFTDRSSGVFRQDWELEITFTNELDGLQPVEFPPSGSVFRSAYEAPESGYLDRWVVTFVDDPDEGARVGSWDASRNYYLRVRSRVMPDGRVRGHYGKIYGEFPTFTHYLNPTFGDRNIEWDPARNLIPPSASEQPPLSP